MAGKKEEAKPAAPEGEGKEAPKKGGMMKMIIMAAVLVVLEGGTVGVTMKLAGGPKRAVAEEPKKPDPKEVVEQDAEVKLMEAKFPNNISGRLFMIDLAVVAKVPEKEKEAATKLIASRDAETRDHIRTIIASSDMKSLHEPGLETIRRQIGYQLEQDLGKETVKEVLIPRCTAILSEY